MRKTNDSRMREIIFQVAQSDKVNIGVAKARFAGEACYSVPSLERLMRGEVASEDVQARTIGAAKARGIRVKINELFPPESEPGSEEAS
jgi:hypothetical protein